MAARPRPLFYYLKSESWNTLFKSWSLEGPVRSEPA